jgi:ABC-2 type transport system permease protein
VEVLAGQLSAADVIAGFTAQVIWLFVALALYLLLWRMGLRRYTAIGG